MKHSLDLTLRELLRDGAEVEIHYYHDFSTTKEDAENKAMQFDDLGQIEYRINGNYVRIYPDEINKGIKLYCYYTPDIEPEYEPEEARARLTEYERGLRDSGHKQSDFL